MSPGGNAPVCPFPPQPLHDYAFLADGERGALVGPSGEICWMCVPRWHHDALFSSLIGGAGVYAVTPREPFVPSGYYEEGGLIWRNRWITRSGIVECRDALAFPGAPGRAVLLRRVRAQEGTARLQAVLYPAAGYGREPVRGLARGEHAGGEVWTARTGAVHVRWSVPPGVRVTRAPDGPGEALSLELDVEPGGQLDLVLEAGTVPPAGAPPDPDDTWESTARSWAAAAPRTGHTIAARDTRRAHAVLRGMTSSTGGMVAAATTSLPEHADEGRNYDYRYVWIRDQCYAGQALAEAGPSPLLDEAVRFVGVRLLEDGAALAPAYTVDGGPVPEQARLGLPGYPGGYDLVGNHVNRQFQLDVFGEALLLFAAAARHGRLDGDGWRAACIAADAVARRRHEADAGIWELEERPWTHSRLICAAGLKALARPVSGRPEAREWTALAERIVAETDAAARHPDGHWQRSPGDPAPDGALLIPPLRGALAAGDARTRTTLDAYRERLTIDHYAYRFRHDTRPLEEAEGAFLLCGFVMALAEHQQGNEIEAHRWFARNRDACGAAGLYAEEYAITSRRLRGNLPQAFVHALMLETASRLAG